MGNFTTFAILNIGGGGGGMDEDVCYGGECKVGWVDGVFPGTLILLIENLSAVKPILFPCHHSQEV